MYKIKCYREICILDHLPTPIKKCLHCIRSTVIHLLSSPENLFTKGISPFLCTFSHMNVTLQQYPIIVNFHTIWTALYPCFLLLTSFSYLFYTSPLVHSAMLYLLFGSALFSIHLVFLYHFNSFLSMHLSDDFLTLCIFLTSCILCLFSSFWLYFTCLS